jgi:hypothetical protein
MGGGRASIFDDEADQEPDLSAFEPKDAQDKRRAESPERVRALAEANDFPSRTPARPQPAFRRGRRTGRNMQLNIKATQETVDLFYRLTDSHGWVLGETLERALGALERELLSKSEKLEGPAATATGGASAGET